MSIALFLKVDGADGESKESAHKDWIDVDAFSWGLDQPAQAHTGGGLGAGKVSVHDLTVTASIDKAFTTLSGFCASGKHVAKAQFAASKAGGDSPVRCRCLTVWLSHGNGVQPGCSPVKSGASAIRSTFGPRSTT